MAKGEQQTLDVPVHFGNASIGETVARLPITIARKELRPLQADKYFCGSRCEVVITLDDGQEYLDGMEPEPIDSTVDFKRYSANTKHFGSALAFAIGEIDVSKLALFANKLGKLKAVRIGDAEEGDDESGGDDGAEGEDGDEPKLPGLKEPEAKAPGKAEDGKNAWRKDPLRGLSSDLAVDRAEKLGMSSVGQFLDKLNGMGEAQFDEWFGEGLHGRSLRAVKADVLRYAEERAEKKA